ncbi:MAG TPA: serine hydrolase domain-containing protein [Thermoanaerobaculia bacterium]|nr:serine hydrolase domain-containing protein [Thermoanaerobaculia bacterium]
MKRLHSFALVFFGLLGSVLPATAQAPATPELRALIERLDAQTSKEFAKDNFASITVGVVSGPNLAWSKSYGWADIEKKSPATKSTLYRIGSITKEFTALMLLQLVQEGKVHFSDPVEKYFPEINKIQGRFPGAPPITLIQLATHTSGLDREPEDTETYLKGPVSEWEKVLIAALPKTRYAFEPGTHYSYSNIGYAALGAALSRAAGQPYVDYVTQRIFKPLGMTSSFFEPNDQMRSRISRGYINEDGKIDAETAEREHQGRGYKVPNGAIYTTVEDLARFVAFQMGEEAPAVLKKDSLDEIFGGLVSMNSKLTRGYGTGFEVLRLDDVVLYGHSGGVAGYEAQAFFDRSSRTGVILLRNALGGSFEMSSLLRAAFKKPPALP